MHMLAQFVISSVVSYIIQIDTALLAINEPIEDTTHEITDCASICILKTLEGHLPGTTRATTQFFQAENLLPHRTV